jgi:CRP-like cAMP-binding protein
MLSPKRRWVDVTERAIYLRSIPVAAELPPKVLHAVAHSLVEREFAKGDKLLEAGKGARALELVTSGKVDLVRGGAKIGELAPPQSVGFLNILARNEAAYDAIATEPLHALELSADRFYQLMEDYYPLLVATLRYLAQRMLAEMRELPREALGLPPIEFSLPVPDRPLDIVERVFFMRCVSAFKNTNLSAVAVLAEHMQESRVPEGHRYFEVGDKSSFTIFILSGTVECETADGRRFEYGTGTAVGGVESLAAGDRWYSARAKTPVTALLGAPDNVFELMEDNFELGDDFVRMLAMGLQGMLAAKAAMGQGTFGTKREVSNLGAVAVGA